MFGDGEERRGKIKQIGNLSNQTALQALRTCPDFQISCAYFKSQGKHIR